MTNSDRQSKNYLDIAIHSYGIPHNDSYKAIEEYAVTVLDFPKLDDDKRIEINAK
jgi:hypothetical protein